VHKSHNKIDSKQKKKKKKSYERIEKEHEHSLDWIWSHHSYLDWSRLETSRLLYIEDKPGSGKSTLAKYFSNNFLPPKDIAIVCRFFYSDREGVTQKSHLNMFRCLLYQILKHSDSFFFHFQSLYRNNQERSTIWDYQALKDILMLIQNHPVQEIIYLIIDALDESDESGMRDAVQNLIKLCSPTNSCVIKVFVSSRPISQVNSIFGKRETPPYCSIKMQDENRSSIESYARRFLKDDLMFSDDLLQAATDYILETAQCVFLWVSLVKAELQSETGYTKNEVMDTLKGLPKELEGLYDEMLKRLSEAQNQDTARIFFIVLAAKRPLSVDELQHSLAVSNDVEEDKFTPSVKFLTDQLIEGIEKPIIHCCGNLIEVKKNRGQ
jgi:hypothetical protein